MGSHRAPGGMSPPARPRPTPMRPAKSGSSGPTCMPPPPTPGRPPPPRKPGAPGMSGAPGGRMPGGTTSAPPAGTLGRHGRAAASPEASSGAWHREAAGLRQARLLL